ncbi:hypothetical protein Trco_006626 [Trichoderma cornu-damae]|uniref:Uncharacterized protein n=1 Tax=Trichoderma cornu-damae TaxID=654480 RepID=A0A9P8QH86_9HYPO|nr:hypothetical protein Trco_006626 [Trichoderma cornu-damae]
MENMQQDSHDALWAQRHWPPRASGQKAGQGFTSSTAKRLCRKRLEISRANDGHRKQHVSKGTDGWLMAESASSYQRMRLNAPAGGKGSCSDGQAFNKVAVVAVDG